MNAALFRDLLRKEQMPRDVVRCLIDSFDRCDPTRSRELKPSQRMREARHTRRLLRAFLFAVMGLIGIVMVVSSTLP